MSDKLASFLIVLVGLLIGGWMLDGVVDARAERNRYDDLLTRVSDSPELQRIQLAKIPLGESYTRAQMERYIMFGVGYTFDLAGVGEVVITPGPKHYDGPTFVFQPDTSVSYGARWMRTQ